MGAVEYQYISGKFIRFQIAESNRIEKIYSVARIELKLFFHPNWNALLTSTELW